MIQQDKELLTIQEVAKILRVDATTVRRWVKSGALVAIPLSRLGDRQAFLVRRSDVEKLLHP